MRINRKNNINEEEQIKPLLKLKPKFNLLTAISTKHFGTMLTILFLGTLLVQNSIVELRYFLIVLATYFLYIAVRMLIIKRQYKRTSYVFLEDRIVILKKYGNHETIMIPYDDIADILFYQNYVQKLFGLGGLGIKIRSGNIFNNIIMLESVKDLFGTIEKIKEILY